MFSPTFCCLLDTLIFSAEQSKSVFLTLALVETGRYKRLGEQVQRQLSQGATQS
jgi:hypothetical protein